jgi:hypothetical protein
MAYSNYLWKSTFWSAKRRFTLLFAFLLTDLMYFPSALLYAAPVALRFEANVGAPRQGAIDEVPPDWNISLQEGDLVSGKFTFEPFDAPSSTAETTLVQLFDFVIQIKSRTLATTQYGIEVFNDRMFEEAPEPFDVIHAGCSFLGGGTECAPSTISPSDDIEWSFGAALFGDATVLDGADLPSNVLFWGDLAVDNTMLVSFKHPVAGWAYGFSAKIESFMAVPELSAHVLFALGTMFVVATHRQRFFRNSQYCNERYGSVVAAERVIRM